jgi:hypothetical protein
MYSAPIFEGGDLPPGALDVFVGPRGQFVAAFEAAALEHSAAVRSGHALAKSVHAHAAADLGLIRSLNHSDCFLIGKR